MTSMCIRTVGGLVGWLTTPWRGMAWGPKKLLDTPTLLLKL